MKKVTAEVALSVFEEKQNKCASPIRVAQIIGKMWAGGVEAVVFNYYRAIDKKQVQFDFYYDEDSTVQPSQELIDMGARFIKLPPYQKIWKYIPCLYQHLRKNKYKIVHSHLNTLSVFPLLMAAMVGVPVRIAHNHSVPSGNEWKRNALKNFLKMFSKVFSTDYFACSEKAGRWLFGNKSYDSGKVIVVPNAIENKRFLRDEVIREKKRKQMNIDNSFVVGHVGRFTYAKNHLFLLEIFKEILNMKPNAKLLLVGDGELRDEIKSKISQLGIWDQVILAGKTTSPEEFYHVIDVIILPSIFEGLSVTTIEAQFSGVPIVISEAVPKETNISNGFKYMKLSDSAELWANAAIELSNISVELLPESQRFDIKYAAPKLTNWYLSK